MTGAVLFQHPRNFAQAGKDNVNASLVETARAEMVLKTRELRRERAHRAVKIASVECLLESQLVPRSEEPREWEIRLRCLPVA